MALHELASDPVHVLIASAFFLTSARQWLLWAFLFTLISAPVEHRIGSRRTLAVFAIGHIGATLITAVGLWIFLQEHLVRHSVVSARRLRSELVSAGEGLGCRSIG